MIFKDLSAWTLRDLITSGHVDGLYWVVLLEQMGSIGKPLGTVSLSAILNLRSPTYSYFDYICISKENCQPLIAWVLLCHCKLYGTGIKFWNEGHLEWDSFLLIWDIITWASCLKHPLSSIKFRSAELTLDDLSCSPNFTDNVSHYQADLNRS